MNFHVFIGGLLMSDEDELREQVAPMLISEENLDIICAEIHEASMGNQPSEFLLKWSLAEPGICSVLEFRPVPTAAPESNMELARRPLDNQLATVAATGLMSGFEDHVLFNQVNGLMTINGENPPTMEEAEEITRRIFTIKQAASGLDEFSKWNLGSWVYACEDMFGDGFSLPEFAQATEQNYNTMITAYNTFKAFQAGRYENLTFSHHKEALHSRVEPDVMHRLLRISNHFRLTCAEQRKLFRYARNGYDIGAVEQSIDFDGEEPPEVQAANNRIMSRPDLVERITVRQANRNYVFQVNGAWYHLRTTREQLPERAANVICTDDWSLLEAETEDGGVTIPEWRRP